MGYKAFSGGKMFHKALVGKMFHKANLTASTAAPWFKLIKDINGKCLKL